MLRRIVLWTLLAACGASQRSGGEPVDPMERIRAECDGLEHDEQGKCMAQKQLQAMRDREHEDIQRKQPTADKPCGEDATPSESATDEGNRRHIEFIQCTTRQRMTAQREREAEQQAQDQRERLERARQRQAERDQRRQLRETAPCTEDNTRQGLKDEIAEQEEAGHGYNTVVRSSFEDELRRRQQQCVDSRIAPCQTKIDSDDDLAGAAACWMQIHDHVDPPDENRPEQVQACFDDVVAAVQEATACLALPERTDDNILAKADCLSRKLRHARDPSVGRVQAPALGQRPRLDNTCGHFSLGKYVDRQLAAAKIDDEATRVEAKAKEPRARIGARNSACNSFNVIKLMESQLERERQVGRESGYVDANKMHEIGSTLVLLREQQRAALGEFRRLWKRPLDRAHDCKRAP